MKRRDFLSATATVALLAPTLLACGEQEDDTGTTTDDTSSDDDTSTDDTSTDDTSTDDSGSVSCTISSASGPSNAHGHSISIPQADIEDPQNRSYTSTGGDHSHTVALTAAELTTLGTDCTVTVSSNDSHSHTWVITIDD